MARLKDVPHVIRSIGFFGFIKRVWQQIGEDEVPTLGSALAYSWLFAIFPFLIFMLSLVPLIPDKFKADLEPQVDELIDRSVPSPSAGDIIKEQAHNVLKISQGSARTLLSFGLLLTIWGASRGMATTISALDRAYDIEKSRSFLRQSVVAILLTIVVATLAILVMILMPVGTGVIAWVLKFAADKIPASASLLVLVNVARYSIALLLMFAITATIYHFGPNIKQKFRIITPGAVFSIAVWLITGALFRIYINRFGGAESYNKTYGTVAGLVILLLFFYLDALVLLVGAEINSEIDFAVAGVPSGSGIEERKIAPIPSPEATAFAADLQQKRGKQASEVVPIDVTRS